MTDLQLKSSPGPPGAHERITGSLDDHQDLQGSWWWARFLISDLAQDPSEWLALAQGQCCSSPCWPSGAFIAVQGSARANFISPTAAHTNHVSAEWERGALRVAEHSTHEHRSVGSSLYPQTLISAFPCPPPTPVLPLGP